MSILLVMTAPAPLPPELRPHAPGVADGVRAVLVALAKVFADHFPRDHQHAALIHPLWRYIRHTHQRFTRLMARLAAGKAPRPSRPGRPGSGKPAIRFSHRKAWLMVALKHHGALWARRLDEVLAEPEAAAILAASPQAQRLLRPLCRMLGIHPAALPVRPRKPRPKPAPKPKRLTRRELKALLWYPNIEGRPMNLIPPRKFRA